MDLEFNVKNQTLTRTDEQLIADRSIDYLNLLFTFNTEDWDGYTKMVLFKVCDGTYVQPLIDGVCKVPSHILTFDQVAISIYGTLEDSRITSNVVRLFFEKSNYTDKINSVDVEYVGDVFTEVFNIINDKVNLSDFIGHKHVVDDVINLEEFIGVDTRRMLNKLNYEIRTYGGL